MLKRKPQQQQKSMCVNNTTPCATYLSSGTWTLAYVPPVLRSSWCQWPVLKCELQQRAQSVVQLCGCCCYYCYCCCSDADLVAVRCFGASVTKAYHHCILYHNSQLRYVCSKEVVYGWPCGYEGITGSSQRTRKTRQQHKIISWWTSD